VNINTDDILDTLSMPPDPSGAAPYPRGLALDLVLEVGTLKEILDSYNLTAEQFKKIMENPAFRREFDTHKESLETEGWSFKKKAQAQAELYLNLMYRLASSDQTPAAVRADIMKSTVKWAGLDAPATSNQNNNALPLAEMAAQLKDLPDGELEMRVMQIVMKRGGGPAPIPTPGGVLIDHE